MKLCAMVKADAYSHGLESISKLIYDKVDYFGVAKVEEAIKIRENGIDTPILCVGSFGEDVLLSASKYSIDLTVYNVDSLNILIKSGLPFKVHLKIDTGMSRLGFKDKAEMQKIVEMINQYSQIKLVGIFSHFIASENDKLRTSVQFKAFKSFTELFDKSIIKHISNSHAFKNKKYQLDMVRVGISLYGYGNIKGLKPVLSIQSRVVDIRTLKANQSVGYNAIFVAKDDCRIATISFGYADGMDMRLSGESVIIRNKKYKIVGKICMDMFMVLVDNRVKVGDCVLIFGNAKKLCEKAGISLYEFLSGIKKNRCIKFIK